CQGSEPLAFTSRQDDRPRRIDIIRMIQCGLLTSICLCPKLKAGPSVEYHMYEIMRYRFLTLCHFGFCLYRQDLATVNCDWLFRRRQAELRAEVTALASRGLASKSYAPQFSTSRHMRLSASHEITITGRGLFCKAPASRMRCQLPSGKSF